LLQSVVNAASSEITPTIAIVGSGPSGCYTAQFLRKLWPASEIAIFDALPTPYGLVRYGVAADHQGAKAVTRQFDRLFERDGVRFLGNVRIGVDVDFDDLLGAFDVVVLATGLSKDRPLDLPQDPNARVLGAGKLLRGVNGYPGLANSAELGKPLGRQVTIVGNGNVAMDALRILVKDPGDLVGSDVDDRLLDVLRGPTIERIDVVGRSNASNAKFDLTVLRELSQLSNVDIVVGETAGDEQNPVLDLLSAVGSGLPTESYRAAGHRVTVAFHFGQTPVAIAFDDGKTVLETRGTDDTSRVRNYRADSVVTAVGFVAGEDAPPEAWCGPSIWRAGWLRRGARGSIPENRRDAAQTSERIGAAVREGDIPLGKPGLSAIWPQIAAFVVEFDDWRKLDEHERGQAPDGRCRRKVTDLDEMVALAVGSARPALQPT
jgi:ferredoxin--NADP+ reductase